MYGYVMYVREYGMSARCVMYVSYVMNVCLGD